MLNSVLIVGVPMVALLAAAYYVFTKAQRDGLQGAGGSARGSTFSGGKTSRPCSSNPRRRRVAGNHDHGDSHTSSESPDSGFTEEEQCEICFENVVRVQLYPCQHSDICKGCVHKLLTSNKRQCPFCRSRIDGYIEEGSRYSFRH
ncbi:uncharacterized protein LOC143289812 [Babylonia areolata]|uniref:uncharacterized protein LOC143289812 n=1 Tax=Babylonia areolata TaxID=304850 RepID=UPI003FD4F161